MKSLSQYILEAEEDTEGASAAGNEGEEKTTQRGKIKFVIWEEPDKKVPWLDNNEKYQKIEYKHEDKDKNIEIDFLLGYVKDEDTWKLWIGKIGAVNYDDDPYCDFETNKFTEAIVAALDKVEEFIKVCNKSYVLYFIHHVIFRHLYNKELDYKTNQKLISLANKCYKNQGNKSQKIINEKNVKIKMLKQKVKSH